MLVPPPSPRHFVPHAAAFITLDPMAVARGVNLYAPGGNPRGDIDALPMLLQLAAQGAAPGAPQRPSGPSTRTEEWSLSLEPMIGTSCPWSWSEGRAPASSAAVKRHVDRSGVTDEGPTVETVAGDVEVEVEGGQGAAVATARELDALVDDRSFDVPAGVGDAQRSDEVGARLVEGEGGVLAADVAPPETVDLRPAADERHRAQAPAA